MADHEARSTRTRETRPEASAADTGEPAGAAQTRTGSAGEGMPDAQTELAQTVAELRAQVTELRAQVTELEDRWQRALADFDNLRKRMARDAGQQRAQEQARAAAEWLPVLDNLDLALQHADTDPGAIVEGVRAVRDQALAVLARLGYPRREDIGEVFDPGRHEAIATVSDADVPAGTILHVVRPGYGDGQHQLRPAAVVVATGAP
jgi:molecular chaperone GrpE